MRGPPLPALVLAHTIFAKVVRLTEEHLSDAESSVGVAQVRDIEFWPNAVLSLCGELGTRLAARGPKYAFAALHQRSARLPAIERH
jgi:hypothetical protein